MRLLKRLKRGLVFRLTSLLFRLFNLMPRDAAHFVGQWITLAAWKLIVKDQHKVRRHLLMALGPRLTEAEMLDIGRDFYLHSARNFVDMMRFRRHYHDEIEPLMDVDGIEHLKRAYDRGRGVVGVTGHIGNYELMAVYLAAQGYRVAVIGRSLYESRLDRMLVENRAAMGLTNLTTTTPPRQILSWLKDGGFLGVLIDTDSSRVRGEFIPWFGRRAYTPTGQTILGLKAGAAFVPMVCLRTPDNRYRAVILPEIEYQPSDRSAADIRDITGQCVTSLEEVIRSNLSQWIWLHNRWRTRVEDFA